MANYAIGDIQGCFEPLQRLLKQLPFNPQHDVLWIAGDLVNRGPQSLEVLRFIRDLGEQAKVVLGNHDLHLLAVYYAGFKTKRSDTLDAILNTSDCADLMHWLRQQPLIQVSEDQHWCMTHAGLPPSWSVSQAQQLAEEVHQILRSDDPTDFFQTMYGNQPDRWESKLTGQDRLRAIVNTLTRMRFIDDAERLDFKAKEGLDSAPSGFFPWFNSPRSDHTRLLFGHWAALQGHTGQANIHALDTGCVWGGQLSALCLETEQWYRVPAEPETITS